MLLSMLQLRRAFPYMHRPVRVPGNLVSITVMLIPAFSVFVLVIGLTFIYEWKTGCLIVAFAVPGLLIPFICKWLAVGGALFRHLGPTDPAQVRLYFDGGSHGNPGISGGGYLILERNGPSGAWNLVWWTAAYFGDDKTNNYAEHTTLAIGVIECARRYELRHIWLHIVGDSQLVLRQLLGTATTSNPSLSRSSHATTTILSNFTTLTLSHTLRKGNTMADFLANNAMHDRRSSTASTNWTTMDAQLVDMIPADTTFPLTPITQRSSHDLLRDTNRAL